MNKRWNYILLNGIGFEHDMKNPHYNARIGQYGDIENAYGRPSQTKISIYNEWWYWFKQHDGVCGVSSKNCNFFTISGFVKDENGKLWQCYITPSHNYCYEVIGG